MNVKDKNMEGVARRNIPVEGTKKPDDKTEEETFLPSSEYVYWKRLAQEICNARDQEKKESSYIKKELDIIHQLTEDVKAKEVLIHRIKAQITQLQAYICFIHAQLETLKYHAKSDVVTKHHALHSFSRESPYPGTIIQRFPVPDKYVLWEVMWLHYEPLIYTKPKGEFPPDLQPYVDKDVLSLQTERVFRWNEFFDSNSVYRNRTSWMTDPKNERLIYRLDNDSLPRNPVGRTGLRGKGALPRWGPNHNVFVAITRWKKIIDKDDKAEDAENCLQYVEQADNSLPGGFTWSENMYEVIQTCFKMEEGFDPWKSSEDMVKFFEAHSQSLPDHKPSESDFQSRMVHRGYMDTTHNTDQAWKEVELWHIHYNAETNLNEKFKEKISWKLLSEEVFQLPLPDGQIKLLQDAIRPLNAKIADI